MKTRFLLVGTALCALVGFAALAARNDRASPPSEQEEVIVLLEELVAQHAVMLDLAVDPGCRIRRILRGTILIPATERLGTATLASRIRPERSSVRLSEIVRDRYLEGQPNNIDAHPLVEQLTSDEITIRVPEVNNVVSPGRYVAFEIIEFH